MFDKDNDEQSQTEDNSPRFPSDRIEKSETPTYPGKSSSDK